MKVKNLNVIKRMWNKHSSLEKYKKEIKEENMEVHRISVTLSNPNHPSVSMRNRTVEKRVKVKAKDKEHAIDSIIHHYKKIGYKVHDHNYIGKLDESDESWAKAKEKEKENRLSSNDKDKLDAVKSMLAKEKKPVKEATALDRFRAAAAQREKEAKQREAEMKARHAAGKEDMKGAIDTLAKRLNKEEVELSEDAYEKAERHKEDAESAKEAGDHFSHHMHMADHHAALADWHYSKGRNAAGDKHAGKAADHEMAAHAVKKMKEEVAANNVGGGNIAGTQGDAGKKPVMNKKPLKRFKDLMEK